MRLTDVGWVWEGQGLDPGVNPSILGIGDGCEYFGLSRANYMFHPNDDLALGKLRGLSEVTCDISKWKWKDSANGGSEQWVDGAPESVLAEARLVSEMSVKYPNVTGGFHDDMLGLVKREGTTPDQYAAIYEALKSHNPALRMWTVLYTHELEEDLWRRFQQYMDVVCLWVWEAANLPGLEGYIARCRELLGGKPLIMGAYLRDYPTQAPVPMDLLKAQWDIMLRCLGEGTLDGFSILSANLIDGHQQQAEYIRDLIAANS